MLRSYLPAGHPLKHLEIGNEKSPAEYVAKMVRVFDLVRTALADRGTCWINVGDTYADDSKYGGSTGGKHVKALHGKTSIGRERKQSGIDAGNLCLIPQRLMIALQDAGWIVRSVVIWHKPSAMPCSVAGWRWMRCRVKVKSDRGNRDVKAATTGNHRAVASFKDERTDAGRALSAEGNPEWADCPGCPKCTPHGGYVLRRGSWRPTSSYEPIIMLAKSADYFADGEAVKTLAAAATISRNQYTRIIDDPDEQFAVAHDHESNQSTANLRDVWKADLAAMSKEELTGLIQGMDDGSLSDVFRIAAEPLREKHYAAFPSELVRRCLQSGTSAKGYCPTCGEPWVRVLEAVYGEPDSHRGSTFTNGKTGTSQGERVGQGERATETKTIGWRPSCSCPELPPRPGLVLDPFSGSGRTALAASRLGLDFVGVELNSDYVEMSERIIYDEAPLFQ